MKSPERYKAGGVTTAAGLFFALIAVSTLNSAFDPRKPDASVDPQAIVFNLVFLAVLGVLAYDGVNRYWKHMRQVHSIRRTVARARKAADAAETTAASARILNLSDLWYVTQDRLKYYHDLATMRAEKSFVSAQRAMWIGFGLILVATVLGALSPSSTTGKVVVGLLGATGGAQAAYVARTFLRAQETASEHLRAYFVQPLEFSRYLAAERLVDGLDVQARTTALIAIATAIAVPSSPTITPSQNPAAPEGSDNKGSGK